MNVAILFSGGKDSTMALYYALKEKEDVKYLLSMKSVNDESYMFHVPNIHIADLLAEAHDIPIISAVTQGVKEEELQDLKREFENLKSLMKNYVGKDHFLVYSGKVKTDDEGTFDTGSHADFMNAIDKTSKILGKDGGLGMKISRITYKEDAKERQQIIKDFDNGDTEGIVAISCLDEGVDIPSIRTAVIMSSSDNPREYIQRRGRVLRICEGKEFADIYDFVVIPKKFEEVVPNSPHSGIELKMIAKEIRRMKEFSKVALNPDETEKLFNKISSAYRISIDEIMKVYGEELNG